MLSIMVQSSSIPYLTLWDQTSCFCELNLSRSLKSSLTVVMLGANMNFGGCSTRFDLGESDLDLGESDLDLVGGTG